MNEEITVKLKPRVQNIYYQSLDDELGIERAEAQTRITLSQAEEILKERSVNFKEVLKVRIEYINIELPTSKLEEYIIK